MIKNSLVALAVVLFILASQQPAEAGPIKRFFLGAGCLTCVVSCKTLVYSLVPISWGACRFADLAVKLDNLLVEDRRSEGEEADNTPDTEPVKDEVEQ